MIDLRQGDCLQLLREVPDNSIDMVLADPPYGTTRNAWDTVIPMDQLWVQYKRVCKKNCAILLFSQMPFAAQMVMSNPKNFRYEIIWQKTQGTGFLNSHKMPLKIHENILVFYKKLPTYNPQKTIGAKPYKTGHNHASTNYGQQRGCLTINTDGTRYPVDVIRFASSNNTKEKPVHPTQKPVPILEWLINTYTDPGQTVLDNCMGAGSTGVACVRTGRHFIGIELETKYFEIAQRRIWEAESEAYTLQQYGDSI